MLRVVHRMVLLVTAVLVVSTLAGPAAGAAVPTAMGVGELRPGQMVDSPDHFVHLVMQGDGNLVVYGGGAALWSSHTQGHPGAALFLQGDGNLVVRASTGAALWATYTRGSGPPDVLTVTNQGSALLADWVGHHLWTTPSTANRLVGGSDLLPGQYLYATSGEYLAMQGDGNLVVYRAGRALWNSGTMGHPGARAQMQTDGNLVVRGTNGAAVWSSGTRGAGTALALVLGSGGNLAVVDQAGRVVWPKATPPTGAQLAGQLLSMWGGRFNGEAGVLSDLQAVSAGRLITNSSSCGHSVTVDARLLSVLVRLTSRYQVFLNNIITGHGCDSALHPKGQATDFERITDPNTGSTTIFHGDNAALVSQFLVYLAALLPTGAGLGQLGCAGNNVALPAGIQHFPDTCSHQHLQIVLDTH